mgnify:FL=1
MKWNGIPGPCETVNYGEVEEYTVNFMAPSMPLVDYSSNGTLGIINPGSLQPAVYPNPAGSTVTITLQNPQTTVKMYDMHGKLVKAVDLENMEVEVDISDLNQGLYMLEFLSPEGIHYEKLIKR